MILETSPVVRSSRPRDRRKSRVLRTSMLILYVDEGVIEDERKDKKDPD